MSIDIIEQQEKLLLACVTLNFVEDLEEFKEFLELSAEEKGYKAVLEYVADMIDNEVIMDKVTDIIEHRIENKEFPKILEKMKKSNNRHYALPMLLQNEQLLTNILDYLPLVEKIFESEENLEVFCQVAERLDLFKIGDEYEDWENVEKFIKSVQTRNGFDNYLS